MWRFVVFLTGLSLLIVSGVTDAFAGRRMALVVGIDDYREIPKLQKAVGDANAMALTLEKLNFQVTKIINSDRRALNLAIAEFKARLFADDIVFVHFSGHGVEIRGENYLLPADIPKPKRAQIDAVTYEAIPVRRLIDQIAASGARTRVVVIDACRDNPFEQAGVRAVGAMRGLVRTEAPAGTFIMYSAGYRQRALDRLDNSDTTETSVYTRVLTEKLLGRGKSVSQIAREVRQEVQRLAKSVGHDQRPAYYDELSSSLVLRPAEPVKPQTSKPGDLLLQAEIAYWSSVKDSKNPEMLKSYLERFPNGLYGQLAKLRLREIATGSTKTAAETAKPDAIAPKDNGKAFTAKVVKLEPQPDATTDDPYERLARRELAILIQNRLREVGCIDDKPDGFWGRKSRAALKEFGKFAGIRLAALEPDTDVLRSLDSRRGKRVCPLRCSVRQVMKDGRCVAKTCPRGQELNAKGACLAKLQPKSKPDVKKKPTKTPKLETKKRKRAPVRAEKKTRRAAAPSGKKVCGYYRIKKNGRNWWYCLEQVRL